MIPTFNTFYIQQLKEFLSVSRKIVITTHHKPDGDAMGSSLALYQYLTERGHKVTVITPSNYPDFLFWLPGNESVINFEYSISKAKQITAEAEAIFCLDFNAPARLEKYKESVIKSEAVKVLIDHHLDPEDFCTYSFVVPESCATCELVYYFLLELDGKNSINPKIAECLYTGIMTDTGSFRFASMTADTHNIIGELMRAGAANYYIHEKVYDNFSLDRTRFLGHCIKDKLVVLTQYKTAYIAVSKEELKVFNHQSGDTEGIVNFALAIKGILIAAFFCETDNLVKISFRSKDAFSVKEVASTHFSGGGHRNAAGGRSYETLDKTVEKFLLLLPDITHELIDASDPAQP